VAENGGTVALQLQLIGLNEIRRGLKRFERQTKVSMEKTRRAILRVNQALSKMLLSLKGLVVGGAVGFAVKDAVAKAIELEKAQTLLNRTFGEGGEAVANYAKQLGLKFGTGIVKTTQAFAKFGAAATAANVPLETQKEVFEATARASIAFGLSQQQTEKAFLALQQIASKGVVSMEELRQQLGEQVPVALAATAEGLGITSRELIKLVESGSLSSADFFEAYSKGLGAFAEGAENADTATAAIGNFQTQWEALELQFSQSLLPWITDRLKDLTKAM